MLNFNIDKNKPKEEIEKLTCEEDWIRIEKHIFLTDDWPLTPIDVIDEDLNRTVKVIDGVIWKTTANTNNVSPDILHLYEKTRCFVFNKLEPEAAEENSKHTEWYGKWCVYCKIWAREYDKDHCPICGHELLQLPLNED